MKKEILVNVKRINSLFKFTVPRDKSLHRVENLSPSLKKEKKINLHGAIIMIKDEH